MAWTPPTDELAQAPASQGWAPPADEVVQNKTLGRKIGEYVADTPARVGREMAGLGQQAARMVTGTVGQVGGAIAGATAGSLQKIDNLVTGSTGSADAMASDARRSFIDMISKKTDEYIPLNAEGQTYGKILDTVMTPVSAAGRFIGDVAEGASDSKFIGDVASDAASALIAHRAAKAVPKAVEATVDGAKKVFEVAGPRVGRLIDNATDPRTQLAMAGGAALSGNLPQAALHGAIAGGRVLFEKIAKRGDDVTVPGVASEAPVTAPTAVTPGSIIADYTATFGKPRASMMQAPQFGKPAATLETVTDAAPAPTRSVSDFMASGALGANQAAKAEEGSRESLKSFDGSNAAAPSRAAKFQGAKPEDASPELYSKIAETEKKYGLPQGLLAAIKDKGEKSGSNATSPVGAQGIFQFMPATWKQYGGEANPRDPFVAVEAAGKFFRDLLKQYGGNVAAAVAHYNGGTKQGKLVLEGKMPSFTETRNYVTRVLA